MRSLVTVLISLFTTVISYSQDPQFSQYYAAPLLLNPAMAGATDCYRTGMNARSQWTGLPGGAFNTVSAYADFNYNDLRSGFGLMALHDNIGTPHLATNEIGLFYSYLLPIRKELNFRFGLQGSFVSRNIDYSRLIFEDQFSGTVIVDPVTKDPVTKYANAHYPDFSGGILLFGETRYWLGLSAHHLNTPDQTFLVKESRLPIKYSLHGGINFFYKNSILQDEEDWTRIIPTFMFKSQAKYDQLDLGIYFMKNPMIFGLWYRGIFLKEDENIRNNDALILQAGYRYNNFSFIYSYDATTSRLSLRNTKGSHEISLTYLFCMRFPKSRKPPRHVRRLPCPSFQKSLRYNGTF